MRTIIKLLKKLILKYEIKHPEYERPIYICSEPKTRNQNKNTKYQIPLDQPQCPIYKDNRCCGGCKYTSICEYCVECHCFGHVYAAMGGNDKCYYLKKASKYSAGRLTNNGKFDWEYYKFIDKKNRLQKHTYFIHNNNLYEVVSRISHYGKFSAYDKKNNKYERLCINELDDCISVFSSYESGIHILNLLKDYPI